MRCQRTVTIINQYSTLRVIKSHTSALDDAEHSHISASEVLAVKYTTCGLLLEVEMVSIPLASPSVFGEKLTVTANDSCFASVWGRKALAPALGGGIFRMKSPVAAMSVMVIAVELLLVNVTV